MLPPADAVLLNPTWGGEGGISLRACASSRGGAGVWLERCEPRPNPAALRTSMRVAAIFSRRCLHRVVSLVSSSHLVRTSAVARLAVMRPARGVLGYSLDARR